MIYIFGAFALGFVLGALFGVVLTACILMGRDDDE